MLTSELVLLRASLLPTSLACVRVCQVELGQPGLVLMPSGTDGSDLVSAEWGISGGGKESLIISVALY